MSADHAAWDRWLARATREANATPQEMSVMQAYWREWSCPPVSEEIERYLESIRREWRRTRRQP